MIELTALPGVRQTRGARAWNARWAAVAGQTDRLPDHLPEEVRRLLASGWVEELVVRGDTEAEMLGAVVEVARASGRKVRMISSAPLADLPSALNGESWARVEDTETASWVLTPRQRPRGKLLIKRLLDLFVAAALLILLLPVLVVTALAVRLTSAGPVLYRWRVLGRTAAHSLVSSSEPWSETPTLSRPTSFTSTRGRDPCSRSPEIPG